MRHNIRVVVYDVWDQMDRAPWITLKCNDHWDGGAYSFWEVCNVKKGSSQIAVLETAKVYNLEDRYTPRYIADMLYSAINDVNINTVEAGTGSCDVYREDY